MKKLLTVKSLKKYFPIYGGLLSRVMGQVKAVDDVSFDIYEGEILGLVGESGCGKTTVGRMTLRLMEPTSGNVYFEGEDIFALKRKELAKFRPKMQIIFQDPYSSLNPRFTVERIIGEAISVHLNITGKQLREKVESLMEKVGLSPLYINRYPHEFSGGQRQRIGIARALSLGPSYIICDEPVSALDVSIQAQIINLLQSLQEQENLSMLFISHDLSVVKHLSQRTAVMYLGKIVELARTGRLSNNSAHPYTQALLASQPSLDPKSRDRPPPLTGDVPTPLNPPSGCHFHPRCPKVMERCKNEIPRPIQLEEGHQVLCHLYDE
ncbi:MAG: ABC transporter ATP-binding protein [Nitrospinaceae bacterium]